MTYQEIAAELTHVLGRTITYRRPGAIRYAWHAHRTLRMPWGMVAVTTTIYTIARLGQAAGITDDVSTVLGRPPATFRAFAVREQEIWQTQR